MKINHGRLGRITRFGLCSAFGVCRRARRPADRVHRGHTAQSSGYRCRQAGLDQGGVRGREEVCAADDYRSHPAVNKAAVELVTKLQVTPVEQSNQSVSAEGRRRQSGARSRSRAVQSVRPKLMSTMKLPTHQAVIDAVDTTLIPSAQNAELKALLVKVRPAFIAHLESRQEAARRTGHSKEMWHLVCRYPQPQLSA